MGCGSRGRQHAAGPVICLGLSLLACAAAAQSAPVVTDSAFLPTGIPAERLPDPGSRGARLVARYCAQCHGIPSPASQSAADWEPTLRRMLAHMERGHHMRGMGGMMGMGRGMGGRGRMGMMQPAIPTEAERRQILTYLEKHSLRVVAAESLPGAGGKSAALFARTCSRCHALPSPAQHAPMEWPAVVTRMRGNMLRFKVDTISDVTARVIVSYLERAAGATRN
jgi:cytochrome c5